MKDKLRIIVTGLIGQHHTMGGVTWDYIQYLIGFKNLGHEVYYFEDSGEWPYNQDGGSSGDKWVTENCDANIAHINDMLKRFELEEHWAYKCPLSNNWFGMSTQKREEILTTADLLINVSGTLIYPEHYRTVKKLVYIDSDPGFTEVKMHTREFADRVLAHDVHFSFGELLYNKDSAFGIKWHPTRSPIVLSEWADTETGSDKYTTIMNWTSYEPLFWEGKVYAQKDVEFIKFIGLPHKQKCCQFEVAMSKIQHSNWKSQLNGVLPDTHFTSPQEMLKNYGWRVVDSLKVCQNIDNYRSYISSSRGEWSVAKGGYVIDKTGWFSCRSACYLASGKPVVVQGTGFEEILPVGEGLFAFNTMDDAIQSLQNIEAYYQKHCRAAKQIAHEYLDSNIILNRLIFSALN